MQMPGSMLLHMKKILQIIYHLEKLLSHYYFPQLLIVLVFLLIATLFFI